MTLADQLLDAQVAWLIGQITGPGFVGVVEADLRSVLEASAQTRLDAVVDGDEVKRVTHRLLAQVPPSVTAATVTEMLADLVRQGPPAGTTPADLIDRASLEHLLGALPASTDALEQLLERLSTNPQLATIASGFVGRIVNDVVATNRAAAEKIPGVGSLVSLGANAAGRVIGVADKQIDALIGETAARSAGFVTRRLNRIIVDTLREPSLREAVLAVYDEYADQPVPPLADLVSAEEAARIGGLVQDVVIGGATAQPVLDLVDAVVDAFLAIYGEHSIASLIEDLGLTDAEVAADLTPALVRAIRAVHDAGALEAMLRERLAPFYASAEVRALLDGDSLNGSS